MNSSIYIDGAALWVLLLLATALFAGFIFFGCSYIAEARSNDRLKRENRKLKRNLDDVSDRLRIVAFKKALELEENYDL